jgi:peptide/nickel transport system substrate-binding protein
VDAGNAAYFNFPRNGYGYVDIKHNTGPTMFAEVRRAIAYCFDRDEAGRIWTGGYGAVVHSRIGYAQWMYTENQALVDSRINAYSPNVDAAIRELVAGGWTLDENGGEYTGGTRHKRLADGSLMPLHIWWFAANVGAMLYSLWTENMLEVGMTYRMDHSSDGQIFSNAVNGVAQPDGTIYGIVSRGADFATMDSPWLSYDPDPATFGQWNTNMISDNQLHRVTMDMRNTEPGDNATYFDRWLEFVIYFNDIIVDLPMYADIFYDFFSPNLINYRHDGAFPWTSALIRAWLA